LLKFSRQDLEHYANKHNLKHREDTSNSDDYYLRNSIRHHLIPCLETLDKSAKASILQSMENLQDLETQSLQDLETLQKCDFSATQIRNIQKAIDGQSGKQFISKTHRAITHDGRLLIKPLCRGVLQYAPTMELPPSMVKIDIVDIKDFVLNPNPNIAQLDFDKLQFPLTLRRWEKGDFFIPFGGRNKQKLSDFFINQKISRFEKERIWLLCSGNNIAWVVGHRIDNRYKISSTTKQVLVIELQH
jgi:tRNA(Ile)-lysidine synthase